MKAFMVFTILCVSYLACGEIDLENVEIPDFDIDDFTAIKDKCEKEGGAGTYDKVKASKDSLQTCITQFANFTVVKNEVEESKKTGSMDEVFAKYCAKRPKLAACVESFTNNLRPCLNSEENKALNITLDALKQLGDFICYRDGDRIAMFIAEGGPECISSRVEGIKSCVNSTFKIQPATVNSNTLPNLLMDAKKCSDLGRLQTCVVEELEKCKESTPANIVDALFKFIKRTACKNKTKRSIQLHNIMKRSAALANGFFYDSPDMENNILNIFKEKCSQNSPDGGYEAFTLTLESSAHCIRNKTRDEPIFVTPLTTFKENINRCVRKVVEKTEACLPEDEKYWPKFYMEGIESLIDFVYKNKDSLTVISRVELINCFQNFKDPNTKKEITKCFEAQEMTSLKKEVVCGKITTMKTCVSDQIQKKCIRDITIKKLTEGFFKALATPCTKVEKQNDHVRVE